MVLRRSAAFSLVELLVVIAVLVLLIALLLPSIQVVKAMARQSVCGSNLRQLGMAVQVYASDQDGLVPPTKRQMSDGNGGFWFEFLAPYLMKDGTSTGGDAERVLRADAAFTRNNVVKGCPDFTVDPTKLERIGYGMNSRMLLPESDQINDWDITTSPRKDFIWAALDRRGSRVFCGDARVYSIRVMSAIWPLSGTLVWSGTSEDKLRHRGRPSWLFCDLHVANLDTPSVMPYIGDPSQVP